VLSALFLIACGSKAKFRADGVSPPAKIAILPTINQTTDVKGGIVFRNLFFKELEKSYYSDLADLERIDSLLNQEGISDGGQLTVVENKELFDMLSVDGLLFIELIECEYQTLGISETRKVSANVKLYKQPSVLIWEDEKEEDRGKSVFDTVLGLMNDPKDTLKDSAEDLGEQLSRKGTRMWLLNHELRPEMETVITDLLDTLK